MLEKLYKTPEVAAIIGYSRQHVLNLFHSGKIESLRRGTHHRVKESELLRFILEHDYHLVTQTAADFVNKVQEEGEAEPTLE